jgi:8-oxo-dGTP diphosphatase
MLTEKPQTVEDIDWNAWRPSERAVLVYVIDRKLNRVLLIHKKRGLGKGKVNAPGGRIEPGETAAETAVRECQEEVAITPLNAEKRMELHFQFTSGYALYGEAFFAGAWEGEMRESDEAVPFWCPLEKLPWENMWEDDRRWLPAALAGEKQRGYYIFDEDRMLSEKRERVEKFDSA